MWGRKKQLIPQVEYDANVHKPIMRCSICTGEKVVGFRNKTTGEFVEVMLIRTENDLQAFMKQYGINKIEKEY